MSQTPVLRTIDEYAARSPLAVERRGLIVQRIRPLGATTRSMRVRFFAAGIVAVWGFRFERKGRRVDAVTQARGSGSVVEHVSQMSIAGAAEDLGTGHPHAAIILGADVLRIYRLPEAGPACSGVELRGRIEQRRAAADAPVDALVLVVPVLPREGRLSAFLTGHMVLLGGQFASPLSVALGDLGRSFVRCSRHRYGSPWGITARDGCLPDDRGRKRKPADPGDQPQGPRSHRASHHHLQAFVIKLGNQREVHELRPLFYSAKPDLRQSGNRSARLRPAVARWGGELIQRR